jgi:hypothetical protein
MADKAPDTGHAEQQVLPQHLQQQQQAPDQQQVPMLPPVWSHSPQQQQQAVRMRPRHRLQSAQGVFPGAGGSSSIGARVSSGGSNNMRPILAAEIDLAAVSPFTTAASAAGDRWGCGGDLGYVQGSSSSHSSGGVGDAGCMLGGAQLSSMSIGELRELLGRVAGLSLAQLQQQMQQD